MRQISTFAMNSVNSVYKRTCEPVSKCAVLLLECSEIGALRLLYIWNKAHVYKTNHNNLDGQAAKRKAETCC